MAEDKDEATGRELARRAPAQISTEAQVLRGAFRAVGLVAGTAVRGTQWVAGTTIEAGKQFAQAAMDGDSTAELAERTAVSLRSLARTALGVTEDSVREIVSYVPIANPPEADADRQIVASAGVAELRRRGDALLAMSADVNFHDDVHPAYGRILGELAPDEARMLRYFALNGPQPSVDVRTNRPLGIGSELVAADLSSVPEQSGVRHPERTGSYIVNLKRLGLVEQSRDPVALNRYMVLEVQPVVEDARAKAGRAPKIVRKSLRLTDFGIDFCKTCFTLDPRGPH